MRVGTIKPKLKVHGVDANGETRCGCGPATKTWNGKRGEVTCARCRFMFWFRGRP
jgi:hypothetical protein